VSYFIVGKVFCGICRALKYTSIGGPGVMTNWPPWTKLEYLATLKSMSLYSEGCCCWTLPDESTAYPLSLLLCVVTV